MKIVGKVLKFTQLSLDVLLIVVILAIMSVSFSGYLELDQRIGLGEEYPEMAKGTEGTYLEDDGVELSRNKYRMIMVQTILMITIMELTRKGIPGKLSMRNIAGEIVYQSIISIFKYAILVLILCGLGIRWVYALERVGSNIYTLLDIDMMGMFGVIYIINITYSFTYRLIFSGRMDKIYNILNKNIKE